MMTVTVTGRNVEVPAATRLQIEKKIGRLHRLLNDSAVSAQCIITHEKRGIVCEITLHARGDHMLVGVGRHAKMIAAVALAIDKVGQQAQRLADRWKTRKRDGVRGAKAPADIAASADVPKLRVIRSRGYAVRPMSVDDAILALGEQAFLVFRQTESDAVAVVFRRPDGHFGLIDTES